MNRYSFNWRSFAQLKFFLLLTLSLPVSVAHPTHTIWFRRNRAMGAQDARWKGQWILSMSPPAEARASALLASITPVTFKERDLFARIIFHYALFKLRCKTITSLTFHIHRKTASQKANRFENIKQSQNFLSQFYAAKIIVVRSIACRRRAGGEEQIKKLNCKTMWYE